MKTIASKEAEAGRGRAPGDLGDAKEKVGADGDADQAEGKAKQGGGELKETWGEAKEKAGDLWEKAKNPSTATTSRTAKRVHFRCPPGRRGRAWKLLEPESLEGAWQSDQSDSRRWKRLDPSDYHRSGDTARKGRRHYP